MSKLSTLKEKGLDMQKINAWLDRISEFDPACRQEVIELAERDPKARAFYVAKYEGKL